MDHRSDIFSLGATLYEMVSGQRAFEGDTVETLSAILKHDPPVLNAPVPPFSPQLASVIQHCLEKERDQRFQSARDLSFALARLTGTPGSGARDQIVEPPDASQAVARGRRDRARAAARSRRSGVPWPPVGRRPTTLRAGDVSARPRSRRRGLRRTARR